MSERRIVNGIECRKETYFARDGVTEPRTGWFYIPTYGNPEGGPPKKQPVGDKLDLIGYFLWDEERQAMYQPYYGATDLPDQFIYFMAATDWVESGGK